MTNSDNADTSTVGPTPRLIVLVHGAWHGAWCWATLQAELDRRGVPSLAVDLPGHGASTAPLSDLHGDADHVRGVLDRLAEQPGATSGGIVLVGHSYGGAVITQAAGERDDVAHLVYVAAFALDDGESVMGALGSFERREVALGGAMVPSDDGRTTSLAPGAAGALYQCCPEPAVAAAIPRLGAQPVATMTQAVSGRPRESIDSTYVRCAQDRAVHPDHQTVMATRCGQRVDLDTDHSPFISAVPELADVLEPLSRG